MSRAAASMLPLCASVPCPARQRSRRELERRPACRPGRWRGVCSSTPYARLGPPRTHRPARIGLGRAALRHARTCRAGARYLEWSGRPPNLPACPPCIVLQFSISLKFCATKHPYGNNLLKLCSREKKMEFKVHSRFPWSTLRGTEYFRNPSFEPPCGVVRILLTNELTNASKIQALNLIQKYYPAFFL